MFLALIGKKESDLGIISATSIVSKLSSFPECSIVIVDDDIDWVLNILAVKTLSKSSNTATSILGNNSGERLEIFRTFIFGEFTLEKLLVQKKV